MKSKKKKKKNSGWTETGRIRAKTHWITARMGRNDGFISIWFLTLLMRQALFHHQHTECIPGLMDQTCWWSLCVQTHHRFYSAFQAHRGGLSNPQGAGPHAGSVAGWGRVFSSTEDQLWLNERTSGSGQPSKDRVTHALFSGPQHRAGCRKTAQTRERSVPFIILAL